MTPEIIAARALVRDLELSLESQKIKLYSARARLDLMIAGCKHQWSDTVPSWDHSRGCKKWDRHCLCCGKEESTINWREEIIIHPKW